MNNINFSEKAIKDMKDIENYITVELCNEQSAKKTLKLIVSKIKKLADFPLMGSPLSSVININTDYRYLVCGNYLAFYRVIGTEICIDRILYGQRNYMQALFGKTENN